MSRIAQLPVRNWQDGGEEIVELLTAELRTPNGTQRLFLPQAVGLLEIAEVGGGFLALNVGEGKTLVAGLAATVLAARSPILVTKGGLIDDTRAHLEVSSRQWKIPVDRIRIVGYEWLSRRQQADFFERNADTDLYIFDEAHAMKNVDYSQGKKPASVPVRYAKFRAAHPNVSAIALSGSPCEEGLLDYAHTLDWTLREGSPAPRTRPAQISLAHALDPEADEGGKPPLKYFAKDYGAHRSYPELLAAYKARLHSTPGVIISRSSYSGARLTIEPLQIDLGPKLQRAFKKLRKLKMAPDDWDLSVDLGGEAWQTARMLGVGYYPKHDPWPPEEWLAARRAFSKWQRQFLEASHEIETPGQLLDLMKAGRVHSPTWERWCDIEPTFAINRKDTWLSDEVVTALAERLRSEERPVCIWSAHRGFSHALAKAAGIPYYGSHGLCGSRKLRDETDHCIASIAANSEGRNLQQFSDAWVVGMPGTTRGNEQLIGRHYRTGQQADHVRIKYLATCAEHLSALDKALRRAQNLETDQPQVLTRATIRWPEIKDCPAWRGGLDLDGDDGSDDEHDE